jgi:Icc-related predicted phosphoesterase
MKVALASDVHLEFGFLDIQNTENADVLILSGDICVAKDLMDVGAALAEKSEMYHRFFQQACSEFRNVVYVMGNHEHYNGDFAQSEMKLRSTLAYLKNLHFLEKESVEIDNVLFLGGTLWTDMNKEDPLTLYQIKNMMNDFRCVKNSNRMVNYKDQDGVFHQRVSSFCPEDAVEDHKKLVEYIRHVCDETPDTMKIVVVGHHAPSRLSIHPRYKQQDTMNGGYSSSLDEFIMDRPQIKLWTHGHTHENFDYMIGMTRVVCNPRGYIGYEGCADKFELKYVEV